MSAHNDINTLQTLVAAWFDTAFDGMPQKDAMFEPPERATRAFEEVVELAQALHVPLPKLLHTLLYTYARPVEPRVEIELGGAALCLCMVATSLNMRLSEAMRTELDRAWSDLPKIRASAERKIADGTSLGDTGSSKLVQMHALDTVMDMLNDAIEATQVAHWREQLTQARDTLERSKVIL